MKLKILYIVNIPSPYRVDFFNELGKSCDLTVIFEQRRSPSREESWHDYNFVNFKGIFLPGIYIKDSYRVNFKIFRYLNTMIFNHIIIGGYSTLNSMLCITYLKMKKVPFILNVDGGMIKYNESSTKKKIKRFFISSADSWLSTGTLTTQYLEYYGANPLKIYVYPFTTTSSKDVLKGTITSLKKKSIREDLGIVEDKVILSVGQFIHRKGFDILIEASSRMSTKYGIYIVGGTPTKMLLELRDSLGATNVHFVDFMDKEMLKKYYYSADVFVLPTREDIWGLVINEALAAGLPVVTTDKCVAGIELIEDNVNGYIVQVNDSENLANKISYILGDSTIIQNMGKASLEKIQGFTLEKMSEKTIDILVKIAGIRNV